MHPCEPSLETLKGFYKELITAPSTDENMKKLKALDAQINRREAELATPR